MKGYLPKSAENFHAIPNARIAIIASMWHADCVDAMVQRAHQELLAVDVAPQHIAIHRLPGAMELPYAARCLFETDSALDAIIAFGIVLKGQTTHDELVLQAVVNGFSRVTERFNKPIINEVIGVNCIDDAKRRADDSVHNKGLEAVFALTELLHWKRQH